MKYILMVDFDMIISEFLEKLLILEKIKKFCVEIFKRIDDKIVGYFSILRYNWCRLYGFFLGVKVEF